MDLHHVKVRDKWDQINIWSFQTEEKRLLGLLIQMVMSLGEHVFYLQGP